MRWLWLLMLIGRMLPHGDALAASAEFIEARSLRDLLGRPATECAITDGSEWVGGLSGIDFDSRDQTFWMVSDDPGCMKGRPRFYNLQLDYGDTGLRSAALRSKQHISVATGKIDPEAIRLRVGTEGGPVTTFFITSEGRFRSDPAKITQPFIAAMSPKGVLGTHFDLPSRFQYRDGVTVGLRKNEAFESLAMSIDQKSIFAATESALIEDRGRSQPATAAPIRVVQFDIATRKPVAQYAYVVSEASCAASGASCAGIMHGVSELLAFSPTEFIFLERVFTPGRHKRVSKKPGAVSARLYLASIEGASDVSNMQSLADGQPYTPMRKTPLLDFDDLEVRIDNLEGMSFGKKLKDGRSLIVISDDNFKSCETNPSRKQWTQVLLLRVR